MKIVSKEEITLHIIFTIRARMVPKWSMPEEVMPPKIEDSSDSIAIAIIGEKSILPNLSQPLREKKLRYGSVIEEMNLPNLVNFAPGTQLIKIEMRQIIV